MGTRTTPLFALEHSFASELPQLCVGWEPQPSTAPRSLVVNDRLATDLGLDPASLRSPEATAIFAGNAVPTGSQPVAMAYAGHQFGGYSPRLGDGRAALLGELVGADGRLRDLHLKGSGRTPFARGGDGRAAVGPMLREYLMGEAMHALGIPTTRALAVVTTGDSIARDGARLPGAVLARVASSHLRVGTFQYAAATGDRQLLRALADHAIARHAPEAAEADHPALALYEHVVDAQASLIAAWMAVGFVHGVMNTDNMTISGETIDYGPCAFMEAYDPATVFSSIDHAGRYAYGNQPSIAVWNLARLAEAMLPLFADEPDTAVTAATSVLETFSTRFTDAWTSRLRDKLGIGPDVTAADVAAVADGFLALLADQRVDLTLALRSLAPAALGDASAARSMFADPEAFDRWSQRWLPLVDPAAVARMDLVNPVYVPRNHLVEDALTAATAGDLQPFERLLGAITAPFTVRDGLRSFAAPAPAAFTASYRTFCGT